MPSATTALNGEHGAQAGVLYLGIDPLPGYPAPRRAPQLKLHDLEGMPDGRATVIAFSADEALRVASDPALLGQTLRALHRFGTLMMEISVGASSLARGVESLGLQSVGQLQDASAVGLSSRDSLPVLVARRRLPPHDWDERPDEVWVSRRLRPLTVNGTRRNCTYVVPVCNEEVALPQFQASLEGSRNALGTSREFIFVINGCRDRSAEIVRTFVERTALRARLVKSEPGIVNALLTGLARRSLDGFVGKLDADCVLEPHVLDLMEAELLLDAQVAVAYAEPLPIGPPSRYSRPEHVPSTLTQRLFFTSKACVQREPELLRPQLRSLLRVSRAEDILLSHHLVYARGLDCIRRAERAFVYARPIANLTDLTDVVSRCDSDLQRLYAACPAFRVLEPVFQQDVLDRGYARLLDRARSQATYVDEWLRIESTKRTAQGRAPEGRPPTHQ